MLIKLLKVTALAALVLALTGCAVLLEETCQHQWTNADCVTAKTCTLCGEVDGEALDHRWINATCTQAKYCMRCFITEGEPKPHDWRDATCKKAKYCFKCGLTEGQPLEHQWTEATCTSKKTCTLCKKTEGTVKDHNYVKNECTACGAKLATTYKELERYLNSKYSKLVTPLGTVTGITFEITDNYPPLYSPCDYELHIETSLYVKDIKYSLVSIIASDYFAYEDRVQTLMAMIEFEHTISQIAMDAFPDKKMKGCFFDWGYEYPNIQMGYWNIQYLTFCNYDGPINGSNYSATTLSHWRINEYGGDGISDYFGVRNALKDDVAKRLPYDITFKRGYL